MKYDVVLFDLDGTLDDSAPGIVTSVMHALKKMGRPVPPFEELVCFVGPPLLTQFMEYCGISQEEAETAIEYYRELYAETELYHVNIYPGIPELLKALKDAGIRLAVATSKPERFARKILERYELAQYFEEIAGIHQDKVSEDKREVLADALERMKVRETGASCVLIGDRKYDAWGAARMGLDFIGVSYGYAPEGEFEAEGVKIVLDSPAELQAFLLGGE